MIRPGLLAPPLVCVSWQRPGFEARLDHRLDVLPRLRSWLTDPETLFTAHFAAYDMTVICAEFPDLVPLVFAAYRSNRVTCTKKRQQLLDIAGGVFRGRPNEKGKWITHGYELADLSKRHLGQPMQKDGWRLSYGYFRDVPLSAWPDRARELQAWSRNRRAQLQELAEAAARLETKKALEEFRRTHGDEIKNLDAIIADVPEGVLQYPKDDATAELGIFFAQEKHVDYLKDQFRQAYADFVLYLSSTWGLRTNAAGVEALRAELDEAHRELEEELRAAGFVREDGTRDMKAIKAAMIDACWRYGLPLRRTDGHETCDQGDACDKHIALDSDACEAVADKARESSDLDADANPIIRYAEFSALTKMLSNDVKMLESGTVYPVHTHYDIAETGRSTSSRPNIQNLNTGRIKNKNSTAQRLRPSVRQAFTPRPGKVFAQADFPQLELYTLAQCCYSWLGESKLGDALNSGLDPHLAFAAVALGIPYDEAKRRKKDPDVDYMRQVGKVFNFGKPGGLGNAKLIMWARKTYGVELTMVQCEAYTMQWHETFPEMRKYFARIGAMFGNDVERASIETLFTERHRGGASYCAACNNGFQALGVDCAKAALCLVAEAEYCDTASPLYGSRTVAFIHDEIIAETDDAPGAHDAACELSRLMTVGANRYLPNVPIKPEKMEPTLMRVLSKEAKQVWDENGRLVPWAPS